MKAKKFRVGVYIDGSNIFWAQRILLKNPDLDGWKLDFAKLKAHLEKKYQDPLFYKYYATVDVSPSNDTFKQRALGEERFRKHLVRTGYEVITKPLKYITDYQTGRITTKGDTDVEVTTGVFNSLDEIDLICLVTGDSDFLAALQDWYAKGKYIQVYSYKHILAREIRDYCYVTPGCSFTFFDDIRAEVEFLKS